MEKIKKTWDAFAQKHKGAAQFLVFFVISNGVTILQILMMPVLKSMFDQTQLVEIGFQVLPVGTQSSGEGYYVFNYAAGTIASGGGGGLAYFLAVEISLLTAQVINFLLQRKVTFKSKEGLLKASVWYFIAWVIISIGAAALQGLYKAPIYHFMIEAFGKGTGTAAADIITMLINALLSFWVFYPIMKFIFKKSSR